MYPVDIQTLARKGTLGSRVSDPTLPDRPSRLARLRTALTRTEPVQAAAPACASRPVSPSRV
jgi:hypothetical protein